MSLGLAEPREDPRVVAAAIRERLRRRAQAGDSAALVEYALSDENVDVAENVEGWRPIVNAPHHEAWHEAIRTHRRVVIEAAVEMGKTTQVGVGVPLALLGANPNMRIAIVSNTSRQAEKVLGAIRANIERNEALRDVFPGLRPSPHPGDPWHSEAITVARPVISRDPSVQALGVGGPLVGSRVDFLLLDDVLDFENTFTPEQCAKLIEWVDTTAKTRVTATGRIAVIGTPWTLQDLIAQLKQRRGWHAITTSVVQNPDEPDARQWRPTWPAAWPSKRIEEVYEEEPPLVFARKRLCRVRSDTDARFKSEWFEGAIAAGKGRTIQTRAPFARPGSVAVLPCFTGVDLGMGKKAHKREGALSCLFTIALDERARRLVLQIESGRWTAPELLSRIGSNWQRFAGRLMVEDNGAQTFLVQWAQTRGIPVVPFTTTGRAKYDEEFGIESLAVELRSGLWVIPSGADGHTLDPEVSAWISEALHYRPEEHAGDRLMASWFAREAARTLAASIAAHSDTLSR